MKIAHKNITFHIEENYENMSLAAASIIVGEVNAKMPSVIGFATGGTPVGTYKELIKMNKNNEADFSNMLTFNLDEYYPISKDNDQSYYYFMYDNLFNHINVNKRNVHLPNGEAADIAEECKTYESLVSGIGPADLQILGIGLNGHIGFNEPAENLSACTHHVTLDESTIKANARFFASEADVPRHAVTMGIGTIMAAKKILLIANGKGKAEILKQAFFGPLTTNVPASLLQLHPNVIVCLDTEAAEEILPLL